MDRLVTTAKDRFWFAEAFARDQWVKAQATKLPNGSAVLDAGAGASKYRPFFTHCNYKTQDFCLYQGPLVRYVEPIDYVCDIAAVPLPDQSLDAILCTEVIEHVVDPVAVLGEFHRLLKPGGKLLLTAPLLSHLHMDPYHYYGGFTHYWHEFWLPRKGFTIASVTRSGGPGRTCATFCQAFYSAWSEAERPLKLPLRVLSLGCRALAKVLVHYVLPYLLPKFDPWLGTRMIYSTCMVAAIRNSSEK